MLLYFAVQMAQFKVAVGIYKTGCDNTRQIFNLALVHFLTLYNVGQEPAIIQQKQRTPGQITLAVKNLFSP